MNDNVVDTNIALCLINPSHPDRARALPLVRGIRQSARLVLPPQACYEAYVVLTRPKSVNGYGMAPEDAFAEMTRIRSAFTVFPDPPNLLEVRLDLCRTYGVSGKPAHDARLAAYALCHRIETLVTLNPRDFGRYGLSVVVP